MQKANAIAQAAGHDDFLVGSIDTIWHLLL